MNSFVRSIQRTVCRDDEGAIRDRRRHFAGRGSKLDVVNPSDPCRTHRRKKPKAWRAKEKAPLVAPARVLKPSLRRSKEELIAAHRAKMGAKVKRRERDHFALSGRYGARANVSQHHPDANCTPREHARRKAERVL